MCAIISVALYLPNTLGYQSYLFQAKPFLYLSCCVTTSSLSGKDTKVVHPKGSELEYLVPNISRYVEDFWLSFYKDDIAAQSGCTFSHTIRANDLGTCLLYIEWDTVCLHVKSLAQKCTCTVHSCSFVMGMNKINNNRTPLYMRSNLHIPAERYI